MNRLMVLSLLLLVGCEDAVLPRIEHPVNDNANVLSPSDEENLSHMLVQHREATGIQMAILTVNSTDGTPIEDFSHRIATTWGGGQRGLDNGVLVTLAVRDHHSRIEVGSGLEAALPDGAARLLLDGARPALRRNDYYGALQGILQGIIARTDTLHLTPTAVAPAEPVTVAAPAAAPTPHEDAAIPFTFWLLFGGFIVLVGIGSTAISHSRTRRREEQERERDLERELAAQARERARSRAEAPPRTTPTPAPPRTISTPAPSSPPRIVSKPRTTPAPVTTDRRAADAERARRADVQRRVEEAERAAAAASRRRRDEEEESRRRSSYSSSYTSSSSSDDSSSSSSSSSDSGSSWGGGGGDFGGGGSSGDW